MRLDESGVGRQDIVDPYYDVLAAYTRLVLSHTTLNLAFKKQVGGGENYGPRWC